MRITNRRNLPQAIVDAVVRDPYTSGGPRVYISASRLSSPPQIRVLERDHRDEIEEDVSDRLFALFGQLGHVLLERAGKTSAITEQRLYGTYAGRVVSGQFDSLVLEEGHLSDYKFPGVYGYILQKGVRREWQEQLQVLATLAEDNGYEVRRLSVCMIFRDWRASEADRADDYPPPALEIDVPLRPREERLAWIEERLRLHTAADRGEVAECTDDERWLRGESWAVLKDGGKRAVAGGVHETKEAAQKMLAELGLGHRIEHRPGRYARCEGFCAASQWCPQWREKTAEDALFSEASA